MYSCDMYFEIIICSTGNTVKQSALGRLLFHMCSIMSNVLPSPSVGNGVWILQTWQFYELTISLNRHSQKEVVVYFNFVGSIGKLLVSSPEITLVSCALISHIIRQKKAELGPWICAAWKGRDGGIRVSSLGLVVFHPDPAESLGGKGLSLGFEVAVLKILRF